MLFINKFLLNDTFAFFFFMSSATKLLFSFLCLVPLSFVQDLKCLAVHCVGEHISTNIDDAKYIIFFS